MKRFLMLGLAISTASTGAAAQSTPYPSVAKVHADPIAAFQGEWVSRFCQRNHRWFVEGRNVKMYKRDPNKPTTDYDNRHTEGGLIYIIREEFDRSDRGVRMRGAFVDPNTGRLSEGQFLALTLYWEDSENDKGEYFGFNEMIRPDVKARQCP